MPAPSLATCPSAAPSAPVDRFDTETLGMHWIPLHASDDDIATVLRERLGVDFAPWREGNAGLPTPGDYTYLPIPVNFRRGETIEHETIVLALGAEFLITLQPAEPFVPFETAISAMRRDATLTASSHGVAFALLGALNVASERVLEHTARQLDEQRDVIARSALEEGHGMGAAAARTAIHRLGEIERIVSRVRETQSCLAAAARRLEHPPAAATGELGERVGDLIADIDRVARRAERDHDALRFLAQSATTCLGARHSAVLRLLTIVVAVFAPPTMLAAVYAADFTWLPDLDPIPALLAFVAVTALAAALPLRNLGRN
ncbi:CorA family divalent cation transporter [Nocardia higoensis]|uniref:CorA family divalent cation transporter n=1 Tax=Nocardia higoensis TaxID=228599 RepID=UPI0005940CD7|nr:CorA family divalent cation transporter [Nocardia higoensis]